MISNGPQIKKMPDKDFLIRLFLREKIHNIFMLFIIFNTIDKSKIVHFETIFYGVQYTMRMAHALQTNNKI